MKLTHLVVGTLLLAASPALSQSAPQEVLSRLYQADTAGGWGTTFANIPTPAMNAAFSSDFLSAWRTAMKRNRDYPVFDADPLTGRQGGGAPVLKSVAVEPAQDPYAKLVATVTDSNPPSPPYKVRYTFIWQDGAWKIDEIEYPDAPIRQQLKAYLSTVK